MARETILQSRSNPVEATRNQMYDGSNWNVLKKKDEPVVVVGDAAVPGAADSEEFGRLFAGELRLIRL